MKQAFTKIAFGLARVLPRGGFPILALMAKLFPFLRNYPLTINAAAEFTMKADFRESVYFPLLKDGYYTHQAAEDLVIKFLVRQGDVAVDVGANIGWVTLQLGRLVGSSGVVFSFEPNKRIFKILLDNISQENNILAFDDAVSNAPRTIRFFSENRSDLSSVVDIEDDNFSNSDLVSATTIDALIELQDTKKLDFLKVDVEGHDYEALCGAKNSIRDFEPIVMFEALSFAELERIKNLFPADYSIFNIKNGFPFRQLNGFNKTNNYIACSDARRCDVSALIKLDLLEFV